jgi:hypothetical protein
LETGESVGIIEFLSKSIGFLGAICLGFSVIYDWGYLTGLGLGFREIPTSLTDHLRSAIIWLPISIPFLLFSFAPGFYMGIRRIESSPESNQVQKERVEKIWIWSAIGFLIFGIISIGTWILLGDRVLAFCAMGIGLLANAMMFATVRRVAIKFQKSYFLGTILFFCACMLFGMGNLGARSKLISKEMDSLLIKRAESSEVVRGIILRRFENCVIFVTENKVVTVLKSEDLLQATSHFDSRTNKGVLCHFFGIACSGFDKTFANNKKK